MIKFLKGAQTVWAGLVLSVFLGYAIYGHFWTDDSIFETLGYAFLLAFAAALPIFAIFYFLVKALAFLGVLKPDELEVGEDLWGVKVVEIEKPEDSPQLSSPSYEELYKEAERQKLDDKTDPPPDLIELYKKLEDKRKQK